MLLSKFAGFPEKFLVDRIPKFVLNCIKQPKHYNAVDLEKLDPVLSTSLLPFQVEGLKYAFTFKFRNNFSMF